VDDLSELDGRGTLYHWFNLKQGRGNMKSIQVRLIVPFVFAVCVASACTAQAQQGQSSDERAIRALIEQANLAMNAETAEKGVDIMKEVLSDKAFAFVMPLTENPPNVIVSDKKAFLEALADSLRNGPRWGSTKVRRISFVGPVAYQIGEPKTSGQDTATPDQTWLNVFAKEDVGWRLVYSTPGDDALQAMRQLDVRKLESAK